jgi:aspartate aminotransferase
MFSKAFQRPDSASLIHLELGQPIHDTPAFIRQAAIDALQAGKVHYSALAGLQELREALTARLRDINRLDVTPDQIIVTNGLTQASYAAIMAVVDPGDEVILLDPYYPQHVGKIEMAGGVVIKAPLDVDNNFSIRGDWIEAKVTGHTKAIVMVNPANPTGRVYSRAELEAVADIARRRDLLILCDEVYEQVTYDAPHISIGSLDGMAERTISLFAFTKAYAMDGWRLGYAAGPSDIITAMLKVTSSEVTHVNTFIQYGALAAVTHGEEAVREMVEDDRRKRDVMLRHLNQMPGVRCAPCEGTIYLFADIRQTGLGSQEAADRLLDEAGVVVEAGSFYGAGGEGFLRICFGSQDLPVIEEAAIRMGRFFSSLSSR